MNENHDPANGQFTSGSGGGVAADKHAPSSAKLKAATKPARTISIAPYQKALEEGRLTGKEFIGFQEAIAKMNLGLK